MKPRKNATPIIIAGAMVLFIWLARAVFLPDPVVWFLCLVPVAFSSFGRPRATPLVFAGVCTALILRDALLVRSGSASWSPVASSSISIALLWLAALERVLNRRSLEKLHSSEARYRKLHETLQDGFVFVNMEGQLIEWNDAYQRMLGHSPQELAQMTYRQLTPPKWHAMEQRIVEEQILLKGYSRVYEKEYRKKDGTVFPVELRTFLFTGDAGEKEGMWAIVRDITERKKLEERLQSERAWSEAIISSAPNIIVGLGEGSKILIFNRFAERLTGYRSEEVMGKSWIEIFIPAALREQVSGVWNEVVANNLVEYRYENPIVTRQGALRTVSWNNTVLTRDGRFEMLLSIGEDITERKRADGELKRSAEQLRSLLLHMEQAREEERKRIAREIHDELGQNLTVLKIDLAHLGELIPPDRTDVHDTVRAMLALLDNTHSVVRSIATSLRPQILDDFGLLAAIEWQAKEFARHSGIPCAVASDCDDFPLDEERAVALFRIFQEAMINIVQHAGATRVTVRLTKSNDDLTMEIADNGKGIEQSKISAGTSLGLIGMAERAQIINGTLSITGTAGQGTVVKVTAPLPSMMKATA